VSISRPDSGAVEAAIFAVWTLLFIGLLVFWQRASPGARRRAQPYAITFAGLVVLLFAGLQGGGQGFLFALIPVAVIVSLNVTAVKTCQHCGAANRSNLVLPVAKYCARCGQLQAPDRKAG
jgi:hypothetical protein